MKHPGGPDVKGAQNIDTAAGGRYIAPMKRSLKRAAAAAVGEPRKATADRILQGAIRVLKRDGFAALSARSIAAEAGTNLALLSYYFGSKEKLLLAVFEELDEGRLERQRRMYEDPALSLSEKWRQAVAFYRRDLADGYVRILQELTAYGYSNPIIGARVRRRMAGWRDLLEDVIGRYTGELGLDADPRLVASAVVSFWYGVEEQHLAGVSERDGRFFELLDAVGDLLKARERARGRRTARPRARASR